MRKLETPQFLVDLYRDLRDRRLLLPSLLLVVALIAVPVGLSHSASSATAPPSAASPAGSKPTSAEPAVLVADTGIRSYRRRLAALKSKNPFQRHFALPKLHSGNGGGLAPATPAPSTPPVSSTPSTPVPPPSTPTTSTPTATTTTTQTVTVTKPAPKPVKRFFEYRVDLKVGLPGQLKKREGVKRLTVLPHQSRPVIVFLGQTADGSGAVFSVSSDVASVDGTGTCIPAPAQCQYLTMKPGDDETFDYTPDGKTYELKLLGIRRVRVSGSQHGHGPAGHGPSGDQLGAGLGTGK